MNQIRTTICLSLTMLACGGSDTGEPLDVSTRTPDSSALDYASCATEERVGGFEIELSSRFTGVKGQVSNGVDPTFVPEVTAREGVCRLLQPLNVFCNPTCTSGATCNENGVCVPRPTAVDLGAVIVDGLKGAVSMTANSPVFFYTNLAPLPHPGFDPGASILLTAEGGAGNPFTLRGQGIEALIVSDPQLKLERGQPARLRWTPPEIAGPARIHANLNIANHGGTPAWIECDYEDSGALEIPGTLIERLLDLGHSGFPDISLTRRTADATISGHGCVDLLVKSRVVLDVEIEGLTSCSGDQDCPDGQSCQVDLTCK